MAACPPHLLALSRLLAHTDACDSLLTCPSKLLEQLESKTAGCSSDAMLTTSAIRRLQSLFGSVRRTYAQLFQLHPSVPFELRALMLPRPPASATLDLVIARCTAPTRPVLRVLPAALPPSARVRARAIVYERCAPGIHLQPLPTLDARDELPPSAASPCAATGRRRRRRRAFSTRVRRVRRCWRRRRICSRRMLPRLVGAHRTTARPGWPI